MSDAIDTNSHPLESRITDDERQAIVDALAASFTSGPSLANALLVAIDIDLSQRISVDRGTREVAGDAVRFAAGELWLEKLIQGAAVVSAHQPPLLNISHVARIF